jgi:hypothetical protein
LRAILFLAGVHEAKYTQSISSLTNYTDVNKKKIKCDVDILLESETFSARSPITILKAKVHAYPNPYINSTGVAIPNILKVSFPRSHLKNPPA